MISLVTGRQNLNERLARQHFQELRSSLEDRLKRETASRTLNQAQYDFLNDNLEKIITSKPLDLRQLEEAFFLISMSQNLSNISSVLKRIFKYEGELDRKSNRYNGYNLVDLLQVPACPYCNCVYTKAVIDSSRSDLKDQYISRPDLDHYFPKGKHPLLALSFYNLIPACKTCNSTIKGQKELDMQKHIHPYIDEFTDDYAFTYSLNSIGNGMGGANGYSIKLAVNPKSKLKEKIQATLEFFKLEQRYNATLEVLEDMILRREKVGDTYLEVLANHTYSGLATTPEELYQLAFGNVADTQALYRRPFSKLTRDLATELGLMKYLEDIYDLKVPDNSSYEWINPPQASGKPIASQPVGNQGGLSR